MFITKLCQTLSDNNIPYAIVGGYAVALHGAVRGTIDIDFVIEWQLDTLKRAESALNSLGLKSIIPVNAENMFNNRQDYIDNRNLIAWNFTNPDDPSQTVDIIITFDLAGLDSLTKRINNTDINILNIDSLIEMKQLAGRPQDLFDVAALTSIKEQTNQ